MIYFDNSATTLYKPKEVVGAVTSVLKNVAVNPGRGGHSMALKGAKIVYSVREKLANFLGFDNPSRVIFTDGCTSALNLAILGSNHIGKHVITTIYEHNSVLRPLFELKRRGLITLSVAAPDETGKITAAAIAKCIRPQTFMVVTTHISNVTGAVLPVGEIGAMCRKNNLIYLVDAAQSVGYTKIDMMADNIDMLAIPAHKGLHGIQGIGALLVDERVSLMPIKYGGTGTDSNKLIQPIDFPEGFEAGTVNLPGIAALGRAIDVADKNMNFFQEKIMRLSVRAIEGLQKLPNLRIYTPQGTFNGIVAFNVTKYSSDDVAEILSRQYDICVRSGLHCAPLIHKMLGTEKKGIVRASLSYDNTFGEVDFFIKALGEIN